MEEQIEKHLDLKMKSFYSSQSWQFFPNVWNLWGAVKILTLSYINLTSNPFLTYSVYVCLDTVVGPVASQQERLLLRLGCFFFYITSHVIWRTLFIQSDLQLVHSTSFQGPFRGSVSCPRTLRHADGEDWGWTHRPWATAALSISEFAWMLVWMLVSLCWPCNALLPCPGCNLNLTQYPLGSAPASPVTLLLLV